MAPPLLTTKVGGENGAFVQLALQVRASVNQRLAAVLATHREREPHLASRVVATLEALTAMARRGGKRWRAVLVAGAYQGLEGEGGPERVVMAGVALELLQAYLLIHDDWMDDDLVRRGGPSVHAALGERFQSKALGDAAAVLAGDHAAALAQEALLAVPVSPPRLLDAMREFARVQREVTLGQMLDVLGEDWADIDAMYELKTGSYTVRGPLLLGAALAGAPKEAHEALERFAMPLGIAFQLRDDILGTFGDSSTTGKPSGNDLRRGKRTALVAEARKDPHSARLLDRVFGVADAPVEEVEAVRRHMIDSGARDRLEQRAQSLLQQAHDALDTPNLSPRLQHFLAGAAHALTEREQ